MLVLSVTFFQDVWVQSSGHGNGLLKINYEKLDAG